MGESVAIIFIVALIIAGVRMCYLQHSLYNALRVLHGIDKKTSFKST